MEAVISTETSANFFQTRQCYSLKVDNHRNHRAEHLTLREIFNPVFHETRIYLGENRVL
jgi:tricorn protease-like protein